jgi:hypothetical protein
MVTPKTAQRTSPYSLTNIPEEANQKKNEMRNDCVEVVVILRIEARKMCPKELWKKSKKRVRFFQEQCIGM